MGKVSYAGGKVGMEAPAPEGIALGDIAEGSLVKLNENGSPVEFYVAKHDYENGLNGNGRTLLVRKDLYDSRAWNSSDTNTYASSAIDTWLNSDYKALLDTVVQDAVEATTFYYTPGKLNADVTTLSRAVFLLSLTELGQSDNSCNVEGSALPISGVLLNAYLNGTKTHQWTRSPRNTTRSVTETNAFYWNVSGEIVYHSTVTESLGSRPCFTLPATALFDEETLTFKGVA